MNRDELELRLADEQATRNLGEDLAAILVKGDAILLQGTLGAGKTTLARSIIRALAGDRSLEVPSPTYTLVQAYDETRVPVLHVDLYRLAAAEEIEELGLEDDDEKILLVEWAERLDARSRGGQYATVQFHAAGRHRGVSISGTEGLMRRIERSLSMRSFLGHAGLADTKRDYLIGDASTRAYEVVYRNSDPLVLMNAPSMPDGPPVRDGKPYSQIARLAESVQPYVAIARLLREKGFSAPAIEAIDFDRGFLLQEHLGNQAFLDRSGRPLLDRYLAAAQLLADLHHTDWPDSIALSSDRIHRIPPYDRDAMLIEVELLIDWYFPFFAGRKATGNEISDFRRLWNSTLDRLSQDKPTLVLRDFHSPNLVWRPQRRNNDRLGLLDFQDAVIGPKAYDVASLAMDARVKIDPVLEARIVDAYCERRNASAKFSRDRFDLDYAIMAAQRNSKILGIFVRLDRRDGKSAYLRHLPRIKEYISRSLEHEALAELRDLYLSYEIAAGGAP